jgi:uncharacterized membrane protein
MTARFSVSTNARGHRPRLQKTGIVSALLIGSTVWCLAILAAPLTGAPWIYEFFSRICHQDPSRSWYLLGHPLPVCIRCASIYFAGTLSLWAGLKPNSRWLRASLAIMAAEFILARLVVDAAALRSLSGILVGLSAAPFVKQGIEELRDAV